MKSAITKSTTLNASQHYELREPRHHEVDAIYALLAPLAREEVILPRPRNDIRDHLQSFVIAAGKNDEIIGCASLYDFGTGLQEIRSLAVSANWTGHGIGSSLIRTLLKRAEEQEAQRVFALTLRPHLFQRCGFQEVTMESLPEKVWKDCRHCPKRDKCDEIAVMLEPGRTKRDCIDSDE